MSKLNKMLAVRIRRRDSRLQEERAASFVRNEGNKDSAGGRRRQGQVRCARRLRRPLTPPAARVSWQLSLESCAFLHARQFRSWLARARRQHARGGLASVVRESHKHVDGSRRGVGGAGRGTREVTTTPRQTTRHYGN